MDLNALLDELERILDPLTSEAGAASLLGQTYEELIGKYRPVIKALVSIAPKIAGDFSLVATAAVRTANEVLEDPALQNEMMRNREIKAKDRFAALTIYMEAGFTQEEAMALVLVDVANFQNAKSQAFRNAKPSVSLKNSR